MPTRVAAVGFVNARPLIHGLDRDPAVELSLDVPSGLLGRVRDRSADVALLPTIDLQREPGLSILPAGGIGCDGATLTVRLFGRSSFDRITTLACDPDSHTSVALARIVLRRAFGVTPELTDLRHATGRDDEARLLIGDKVVCEEPGGFPRQLDLGAAWKELTGLPFVFAVWAARDGVDLDDLPARLAAARVRGLADLPRIVREHAVPRGWPAAVAMRYFTQHLRFEVGQRQIDAIRRFHAMAAEDKIVPAPPLEVPVARVSSDTEAGTALCGTGFQPVI